MEKLEWCGYPEVKKIEDTFRPIRFDRIHERDRRTDRQTCDTSRRHRPRLCIALASIARRKWIAADWQTVSKRMNRAVSALSRCRMCCDSRWDNWITAWNRCGEILVTRVRVKEIATTRQNQAANWLVNNTNTTGTGSVCFSSLSLSSFTVEVAGSTHTRSTASHLELLNYCVLTPSQPPTLSMTGNKQ